MRTSGLICILAAALAAQQGQLAGPTSGLVFDWTRHTLRPVLGIPGASTIGMAVDPGRDLASAWVSPRLDSAIAAAADGSLRYYRINGASLLERQLEGVSGTLQTVVFSPSGTAAVFSTSGGAYVITGLPDAPRMAGTVDLDSAPRRAAPSGRPTLRRLSIAISDDGSYVLSNRSGSVRVLTIGGENRELTGNAANAVVAFAPGSQDAAVAGAGLGVILFHDLARAGSSTVLAASVASADALAFSGDGRRLFLASGRERSVIAFDTQSGHQTTLSCDFAPASLVRMGNVFRLNELNGRGPLWLLDASASDPRIVFVPAAVD
jgi:WD40 repeat protein